MRRTFQTILQLNHFVENNRCRMAELTASEMSASSSTSDNKKARRRRKIIRCCGLYSPKGQHSGEHPQPQADVVNDQDPSRAETLRRARNVCRAFAMYSKIHGMKNVYRAEGQWKSALIWLYRQELIRRWDSERELLYDDNIHVGASAYAHWTDLPISTFCYKYLW